MAEMNDRVNRYGMARVDRAMRLLDLLQNNVMTQDDLGHDWRFLTEERREEILADWLDIILEWEGRTQ